MPLGVVSGDGRGMGVLDWVVIVEGRGSFGGEYWASHCNHATETATRSSQITLGGLVYD